MHPPITRTGRSAGSRLAGLASVCAWIFGVGSLLALGLILITNADAKLTHSAGIFCWNASDGARRTGWLMNYSGDVGYLTAAAQAAVVLLALIGSCLRRSAVRHASLLILLVWAGLWTAGAARMMVGMGTWDTVGYTLCTTLALVSTHARARRRWVRPGDSDAGTPSAAPLTA